MLQVLRQAPKTSRWTSELAKFIEDLWRKNLSATEIVDELAQAQLHFSRNAVIGKLHRMGLTHEQGGKMRCDTQAPRSRVKSAGELLRRVEQRKNRKHKAAERRPMSMVHAERAERAKEQATFYCEGFKNLTVLELTDDTCRWPEGGEAGPGTIRFCGQKPFESLPYCAFHFSVSRQAVRTRAETLAGSFYRERGWAAKLVAPEFDK